jgi:hypothetical protein
VFRTWVVDAEGAGLVVLRDQAAADVADLARRGTPWTLPVGVRNRLERWEFDDVTEALTAADEVLARRGELESIESAVGVDEPDLAGPAYGAAPMGADRAADFTAADLTSVDFSEANRILDEQIGDGMQLTDRLRGITELADPAEVNPPAVASIDGVDDFDTALDAADAQLLALEQIIEVEDRLDATPGPLAQIGTWGSDIDADVDEARSQLESGDTDAALATLASIDDQIDDLAARGVLRLAITATSLVALLVAIALIRRRVAPADATTAVEESPPDQ